MATSNRQKSVLETKEKLAAAVMGVSALIGFARPAQAAVYYWDTSATGLWSTGANWSNDAAGGGTTGVVPLATDNTVFNQSSVNGAQTVQLNAATSIAGITFANTGTTLLDSDSTTARTLTVGAGGITVNPGAGAVTLGNAANLMPLALNGNQSWANNSSSLLTVVNGITNSSTSAPVTLTVNGTGPGGTTFSGVISNNTATTAVVVNTSGGTTTFSGGNSFSGGFTLTSGSVKSTATTGLGTVGSALTLNGGTLELASMSGATTSLTLKTAATNTTTVGGNTTIISNRAASAATNTDYQFAGLSIGACTLTADKGANVTGAALARVSFFGALTLTGNATFDTEHGTLMVLNNDSTAGTPSVKLTGNYDMTFQSGDGTGLFSLRCPYASTRSSGVTTLNSGSLALNSGAAGSGLFFGSTAGTSLVLNGGTLDLQVQNAIAAYNTTVGGNVTVKISNTANAQTLGTLSMGAQTLSVTGNATGAARLGFGATTLTGNAAFSVALGTATTTTLTLGAVGDGGNSYGITKSGAQTMILSVANTFSGSTLVSAGTLRLDNSLALQNSAIDTSGTGVITLNGVTAPTFGGLLDGSGQHALATVITTGYSTLTSITLNPGTGITNSYSGAIADGSVGMTLTKTGLGTQILAGTSTYTGMTTVNQGKLIVNGSLASSAVQVNTTGTLGGDGTMGAVALAAGGIIAPGNSIGTIHTGTLDMTAGGTYAAEINTSSGSADTIAITGDLNLAGNLAVLSLTDLGANQVPAGALTLITYTGTWDHGIFAGLANGSSFTSGSNTFTINYDTNMGAGVSAVTLSVPEPASLGLFALAACGLLYRCRRMSHD